MADNLLKQILKKLNNMDEKNQSFHKEFAEFKDQTNKKLNLITEQVVKNSELTILSEAQALLIAGQQKQDKVLKALAMRSLEQETDIKDLKRIK